MKRKHWSHPRRERPLNHPALFDASRRDHNAPGMAEIREFLRKRHEFIAASDSTFFTPSTVSEAKELRRFVIGGNAGLRTAYELAFGGFGSKPNLTKNQARAHRVAERARKEAA